MADVIPEVFERLEQIEKRLSDLEGKGSTTTAPALSSTATPPFDTAKVTDGTGTK